MTKSTTLIRIPRKLLGKLRDDFPESTTDGNRIAALYDYSLLSKKDLLSLGFSQRRLNAKKKKR